VSEHDKTGQGEADPTGGKGRLEAFSDGVIAILVTIMVLELKVPDALAEGLDPRALSAFWPKLGVYALSFLVLAIMWVNHHAMTRDLKRLEAPYTWMNMLLLFGMSLIPLVTDFYGGHIASPYATASYAGVLALTSWTFVAMRGWLMLHEADPHKVAKHRALERKNLFGASCYTASIALAFVNPWISLAIFILIPATFFTPDFLLPKGLKE
jgi:uncharacterized membrane protein